MVTVEKGWTPKGGIPNYDSPLNLPKSDNPYAQTNLVHTSDKREVIFHKLDTIVLDKTPDEWANGIPLSEIIRYLISNPRRATRKRRASTSCSIQTWKPLPTKPRQPLQPRQTGKAAVAVLREAVLVVAAGAAGAAVAPRGCCRTSTRPPACPMRDLNAGAGTSQQLDSGDFMVKIDVEQRAAVRCLGRRHIAGDGQQWQSHQILRGRLGRYFFGQAQHRAGTADAGDARVQD